MTTLASHLSTFLREYLPRDRAASTHTCETYAYSLMAAAVYGRTFGREAFANRTYSVRSMRGLCWSS